MAISIRRAKPADSMLLFHMIHELACYENEERSVKVTAADLYQQLHQPSPPFECAIAESDGKPCGFALYFYAYSTWEGSRTLYLEDLYVTPECRGSGAGAALMMFLAQTAREQQCRRFEWSVLDWNQSAIDFYERLGARPINGWTRYRLDAAKIEELLKAS